ncbi:arsenic resistance N-acetyltransferase ArsN2 [Candidatus Bipolaricaulota bacterium]
MDRAKQTRSLELRNAQRGDYEAICLLLSRANLPTRDLSHDSFEHFLVCVNGEAVVGVVGLESYGASALARSLAVDVRHRSQGVAARLLREVEGRALNLGVTRLFALTLTAQRYLEQKGFDEMDRACVPEEIRATAQFSQLCPESARCLVKSIHRHPIQQEGVA